MRKLGVIAGFLALFVFLSGCGSSSSPDSEPVVQAGCVLGSSTVGNCKI